jgi:hypothetical protein
MATAVKTARTIVAASTANTAGSTTRGRLDLQTALGGRLTIKLINGASPPTIPCTCNILVAHNATMPAAGSEGADWKTIYSFNGGTVASATTTYSDTYGMDIMSLEVEFTGNTAQTVTVEAYFSEVTSAG